MFYAHACLFFTFFQAILIFISSACVIVNGYACSPYMTNSIPCDNGSYCLLGSLYPTQLSCARGYYLNNWSTSGSSCELCPAGYFCDSSTGSASSQPAICPPGYYCPDGTRYATEYPCPDGSKSDIFGGTSTDSCITCEDNEICVGGQSSSLADCPPGILCGSHLTTVPITSSDVGESCPLRTYKSPSVDGSEEICLPCNSGSYCLSGSSVPRPCPAGSFSINSGVSGDSLYSENIAGSLADSNFVSGTGDQCVSCLAGYYCPAGSASPQPCGVGYHSLRGASYCDICPLGYYCPTSTENTDTIQACTDSTVDCYETGISIVPSTGNMPCPLGQQCYNITIGLTQAMPRVSATAGQYIDEPGLVKESLYGYFVSSTGAYAIEGPCDKNFLCAQRSTSEYGETTIYLPNVYTFVLCEPGMYRPLTAGVFYLESRGNDQCSPCPAGSYCPMSSVLLSSPIDCPAGSYCPEGSSTYTPCPAGTYSPTTNIREVDSCTPCQPGRYCAGTGNTETTGPCSAGYECLEGSPTSTPDGEDTTGGPCPQGRFCLTGEEIGSWCPSGYYSVATGQSSSAECSACPGGKYCIGTPDLADCTAGFYCVSASSTATENAASPGYYTLSGSSIQTACSAGTFQSASGQSSCVDCPEGHLCATSAMSSPSSCPAGSYCPSASVSAQECPVGTFMADINAPSLDSCKPCDEGCACTVSGSSSSCSAQCAAGYFCQASATSTSPSTAADMSAGICPSGAYCPQGSTSPTLCSPGSYNPSTGSSSASDCLACTAGQVCSGSGLTSPQSSCQAGYYCPSGSSSPTQIICPSGSYCPAGAGAPTLCSAGYYAARPGMTSCESCVMGRYCDSTGSTTLGVICPVGHYCIVAASVATPCALGSFNPSEGGLSEISCLRCLAGEYCDSTGLSSPSGDCTAGYYCPEGSTSATAIICPAGYYCPSRSAEPLTCRAGYYCASSGLSSPSGDCTAGYYCPEGSTSATAIICPAGYYCPAGSSTSISCPAGTYLPTTGAMTLSSCLDCTAGSVCSSPGLTAPSGLCEGGYFCPSGSSSSRVPERACPAGYACPEGSAAAVACDSGMIQTQTLQTTCEDCREGFYCPDALTEVECPVGYYCSSGLSSPTACAAGTFNSLTQQVSVDACTACTPGQFCATTGLSTPTSTCTASNTCPSSSISPTPCSAGELCTSGQSSAAPAPIGHYSDSASSSASPLECSAGTFCLKSSTSSTAAVDFSSSLYSSCLYSTISSSITCPEGHFCEAGSQFPIACPRGTLYSASATFWTSVDDCIPCPAGSYCNAPLLSSPSGECMQGFYCPLRSTSPTQTVCPEGYECPAGSLAPTACVPGTFYPSEAGAACITCPAGYYCPDSKMVEPIICPAGYYCLSSASSATPCPLGYFNPSTGASSSDDCFSCLPGMTCDVSPMDDASSLSTACPAGTLCRLGMSSSSSLCDASLGAYESCVPGRACPSGHYCPSGTLYPIPCPSGTYVTYTSAQDVSECIACPAGYACLSGGSQVPCNAGFVCLGGSSTSSPTDGVMGYMCPAGYYCPSGSSSTIPCDVGTYMPYQGSSSCLTCPAGYVCSSQATSSLTASARCPAGSFCPQGSSSETQCPAGTYGLVAGLAALTDCSTCPGGRYCATAGLTTPTGVCQSGYYCNSGSTSATQNVCPTGHYCASGTATPSPCTLGTFNANTGGQSSSDCTSCTGGSACTTIGLSSPDAVCNSGHYCTSGVWSPSPSGNLQGQGDLCKEGYYCPEGSSAMIPCPENSYQDVKGQSTCKECPRGLYCAVGSATPGLCTSGKYCPAASSPEYCPDGSFSEYFNLYSAHQCSDCIAAYSCSTSTKTLCSAGYLCIKGADSITPSSWSNEVIGDSPSLRAGPCPAGHYCTTGTVQPTSCPTGSVNPDTGAASASACTSCPAGYFCGNYMLTPTLCPAGSYCPVDSNSPTSCPIGTYNPNSGSTDISSCLACTDGYSCRVPGLESDIDLATNTITTWNGLSDPAITPCPLSQYCSGGTVSACPAGKYGYLNSASSVATCQDCIAGLSCTDTSDLQPEVCHAGYYCPAGASNSSTVCPAGFYCPSTGSENSCAAGFYCKEAATVQLPCTAGHYCPSGSSSPTACPAGTHGPSGAHSGSSQATSCSTCPAGSYSSEEGMPECSACEPGYICLGGTSSRYPTDSTTDKGYKCPRGYYCPSSSSWALPCPAGTFGPTAGVGSLSGCEACPRNSYTSSSGQSLCSMCGSTSTADEGSTTCTCTGINRIFQSSGGACVCPAGFESFDTTLSGPAVQVDPKADGNFDCQLIEYPMCSDGELSQSASSLGSPQLSASSKLVRSSSGGCVQPSAVDCTTDCGEGGGEFKSSFGRCQCYDIDLTDSVCDDACVSSQYNVEYDVASDSLVFYQNSDGSQVGTLLPISSVSSGGRLLGSIDCYTRTDALEEGQTVDSCGVQFLSLSSDGSLKGLLGPPASLVSIFNEGSRRRRLADNDAVSGSIHDIMPVSEVSKQSCDKFNDLFNPIICSQRQHRISLLANGLTFSSSTKYVPQKIMKFESPVNLNSEQARLRKLQTIVEVDPPGISNPVMCIASSTTLVWEVSPSSYPIYVSTSLLNSNAQFDYGDFQKLASDMNLAQESLSASSYFFAFLFKEDGVYVFANSADEEKSISIISVMPVGVECSATLSVPQALTESSISSSLASMSTMESDIQEKQSVTYWITVILLIFAIFVIMFAQMSIFRRRQFDIANGILIFDNEMPLVKSYGIKSNKLNTLKDSQGQDDLKLNDQLQSQRLRKIIVNRINIYGMSETQLENFLRQYENHSMLRRKNPAELDMSEFEDEHFKLYGFETPTYHNTPSIRSNPDAHGYISRRTSVVSNAFVENIGITAYDSHRNFNAVPSTPSAARHRKSIIQSIKDRVKGRKSLLGGRRLGTSDDETVTRNLNMDGSQRLQQIDQRKQKHQTTPSKNNLPYNNYQITEYHGYNTPTATAPDSPLNASIKRGFLSPSNSKRSLTSDWQGENDKFVNDSMMNKIEFSRPPPWEIFQLDPFLYELAFERLLYLTIQSRKTLCSEIVGVGEDAAGYRDTLYGLEVEVLAKLELERNRFLKMIDGLRTNQSAINDLVKEVDVFIMNEGDGLVTGEWRLHAFRALANANNPSDGSHQPESIYRSIDGNLNNDDLMFGLILELKSEDVSIIQNKTEKIIDDLDNLIVDIHELKSKNTHKNGRKLSPTQADVLLTAINEKNDQLAKILIDQSMLISDPNAKIAFNLRAAELAANILQMRNDLITEAPIGDPQLSTYVTAAVQSIENNELVTNLPVEQTKAWITSIQNASDSLTNNIQVDANLANIISQLESSQIRNAEAQRTIGDEHTNAIVGEQQALKVLKEKRIGDAKSELEGRYREHFTKLSPNDDEGRIKLLNDFDNDWNHIMDNINDEFTALEDDLAKRIESRKKKAWNRIADEQKRLEDDTNKMMKAQTSAAANGAEKALVVKFALDVNATSMGDTAWEAQQLTNLAIVTSDIAKNTEENLINLRNNVLDELEKQKREFDVPDAEYETERNRIITLFNKQMADNDNTLNKLHSEELHRIKEAANQRKHRREANLKQRYETEKTIEELKASNETALMDLATLNLHNMSKLENDRLHKEAEQKTDLLTGKLNAEMQVQAGKRDIVLKDIITMKLNAYGKPNELELLAAASKAEQEADEAYNCEIMRIAEALETELAAALSSTRHEYASKAEEAMKAHAKQLETLQDKFNSELLKAKEALEEANYNFLVEESNINCNSLNKVDDAITSLNALGEVAARQVQILGEQQKERMKAMRAINQQKFMGVNVSDAERNAILESYQKNAKMMEYVINQSLEANKNEISSKLQHRKECREEKAKQKLKEEGNLVKSQIDQQYDRSKMKNNHISEFLALVGAAVESNIQSDGDRLAPISGLGGFKDELLPISSLINQIRVDFKSKDVNKGKIVDSSTTDANQLDKERQLILAIWRSAVDAIADDRRQDSVQQIASLDARLASRRARRLERQQKDKRDLLLQQSISRTKNAPKYQAVILEDSKHGDLNNLRGRAAAAEANAIVKQAKDDIIRKNAMELAQFEDDQEQAALETMKALQQEISDAKRTAEMARLETEKNIQARKIALEMDFKVKQSLASNAEERDKLLREHEISLIKLEEEANNQINAQEADISNRLEARKKRLKFKMDAMKEKNQVELELKKLELHKKESEILKDVRAQAISDLVYGPLTNKQDDSVGIDIQYINDPAVDFKMLIEKLENENSTEAEDKIKFHYSEKLLRMRKKMDSLQNLKVVRLLNIANECQSSSSPLSSTLAGVFDVEDRQILTDPSTVLSSASTLSGPSNLPSPNASKEEIHAWKVKRAEIIEAEMDILMEDEATAEMKIIDKEHAEDLLTLREAQVIVMQSAVNDFKNNRKTQGMLSKHLENSILFKLEELQKELESVRKTREENLTEQTKRLEAIQAEIKQQTDEISNRVSEEIRKHFEKRELERQKYEEQEKMRIETVRVERMKKAVELRESRLKEFLSKGNENQVTNDSNAQMEKFAADLKNYEETVEQERIRQKLKFDQKLQDKRRQREALLFEKNLKLAVTAEQNQILKAERLALKEQKIMEAKREKYLQDNIISASALISKKSKAGNSDKENFETSTLLVGNPLRSSLDLQASTIENIGQNLTQKEQKNFDNSKKIVQFNVSNNGDNSEKIDYEGQAVTTIPNLKQSSADTKVAISRLTSLMRQSLYTQRRKLVNKIISTASRLDSFFFKLKQASNGLVTFGGGIASFSDENGQLIKPDDAQPVSVLMDGEREIAELMDALEAMNDIIHTAALINKQKTP